MPGRLNVVLTPLPACLRLAGQSGGPARRGDVAVDGADPGRQRVDGAGDLVVGLHVAVQGLRHRLRALAGPLDPGADALGGRGVGVAVLPLEHPGSR